MPKRLIPSVEGYAQPDSDGQLFAPAAARNVDAIGDLLARVAPARGAALELASGTGQHVTAFAARLPDLDWQPTEIDATRRAGIDARVSASGLGNIAPAIPLDATAPGWGAAHGDKALILLSNLLHLVSDAEAETLIGEAAAALAPGGVFVLYGPFMRNGALTSEGDVSFHASIQRQDAEAGYKDDGWVADRLAAAGLALRETAEMPANNLAFVATRQA